MRAFDSADVGRSVLFLSLVHMFEGFRVQTHRVSTPAWLQLL